VIGGGGPLPTLIGALAGGLLAVAARRALLASRRRRAGSSRRSSRLRRAGREGYAPLDPRAAPTGGAGGARRGRGRPGWWPAPRWRCRWPSPPRPPPAGRSRAGAVATGSRVERSLPEVATAIADSLSAGRSLRSSLPAAAAYLDARRRRAGRLGAELDLGAPTAEAIATWRARMRRSGSTPSPRRCSASGLPAATSPACCGRFASGAAEARPGRRRRQIGDRAGTVHWPSRRRDADRRGALRRAARAGGFPRQAARLDRLRGDARLAAALQLVGFWRSGALAGGGLNGAGLLAAIAVLCGFAAAGSCCAVVLPDRRDGSASAAVRRGRRCASGCRSGCGARGSRPATRCRR